jgi:hypothetical protein
MLKGIMASVGRGADVTVEDIMRLISQMESNAFAIYRQGKSLVIGRGM